MNEKWIPHHDRSIWDNNNQLKNDFDCVVQGTDPKCAIPPADIGKVVFDLFVTALVKHTQDIRTAMTKMQSSSQTEKDEGKALYDQARTAIANIVRLPTQALGFDLTHFVPVRDSASLKSIIVKAEAAGTGGTVEHSSSPPNYGGLSVGRAEPEKRDDN